MNNVLLINGPNLNLLGIREQNIYGNLSLEKLVNDLINKSKDLNINLNHIQSNSESIIINNIHNSKFNNINFIIINAGAFTHTSIAIRDAFLSVKIPFIEIHISNIYSRDPFRKFSYLSDIAIGTICGLGISSYYFAIQFSKDFLIKNNLNKNNV
ncbi:type II 3-dehydroquinate dehydratase [endosymbiont of Pachyrhynchus infernalis]|uniref:type II 3-dehydroquinate dehydratase n=1 Tax=endosymbiont of Pachyrhynchus infernalis TaxID=1971488 RepID=UPI00102EC0BE|nr:type II 3-dehydroquinate dehydratase [endosymbiont of Pachyrhynchus infernalis]